MAQEFNLGSVIGPQGPKGDKGDNGGIPEAPINGKQYTRKDAAWSEVQGGGGTFHKISTTTMGQQQNLPGFLFSPVAVAGGTALSADGYLHIIDTITDSDWIPLCTGTSLPSSTVNNKYTLQSNATLSFSGVFQMVLSGTIEVWANDGFNIETTTGESLRTGISYCKWSTVYNMATGVIVRGGFCVNPASGVLQIPYDGSAVSFLRVKNGVPVPITVYTRYTPSGC